MNNKVLIIVGGVLVALALFLAGLYVGDAYYNPYLNENDQKAAALVADNFVKDLTSDKVAAAYDSTSTSLQKEQTKDAFVAAMGNLKAENASYQEAQVLQRDNAVVYLQTVVGLPESSSKSNVGNFNISLIKEKDGWKVEAVNVQ